jgi:hypothetical protein
MPKIEDAPDVRAAATLARMGCRSRCEDALILLGYVQRLVAFLLIDFPDSPQIGDLAALFTAFGELPTVAPLPDFTAAPSDADLDRVLTHLRDMP